ncbi:ferredoxin reductase-like protein [Parathielavia appendiculata]|uniref:NADH-cytochrome b5 reductase n=1 Tax=Parathielavia appendiculata TaxID=2587402 RepID=A0AAN6U8L4_9PEZI|nr:ferredoxin reductase-like protein [Parathielavia appendiculata]
MSLFVASRSAFRVAAPLKRQFQARRYATEQLSTDPKKGNNMLLYGAVAVALAGVGYYFSRSTPAVKKAEETVKDTAGAATEKLTSGEAKKALTGGDQGWVSLKLEEVEMVNHNSKRFRFRLPEDDMVSGLQIASAILTKFKPNDPDAKPVIRPYTPISDEDAKGYIDLLVKKYPNGPMSTHLHDMVPGQRLDVKGPIPKYPWQPNKHKHIALIAGGTGITPMWQLCRAIFSNPDDTTKVTLVFGNVSEDDILLKNELATLENHNPRRFRAFYVLDNPPKEWTGGKGYINKELLKTVLPEPKEDNIKVFVCGPPGMMDSISGNKKSPKDQGELKGILKELGYTEEQVYKF